MKLKHIFIAGIFFALLVLGSLFKLTKNLLLGSGWVIISAFVTFILAYAFFPSKKRSNKKDIKVPADSIEAVMLQISHKREAVQKKASKFTRDSDLFFVDSTVQQAYQICEVCKEIERKYLLKEKDMKKYAIFLDRLMLFCYNLVTEYVEMKTLSFRTNETEKYLEEAAEKMRNLNIMILDLHGNLLRQEQFNDVEFEVLQNFFNLKMPKSDFDVQT